MTTKKTQYRIDTEKLGLIYSAPSNVLGTFSEDMKAHIKDCVSNVLYGELSEMATKFLVDLDILVLDDDFVEKDEKKFGEVLVETSKTLKNFGETLAETARSFKKDLDLATYCPVDGTATPLTPLKEFGLHPNREVLDLPFEISYREEAKNDETNSQVPGRPKFFGYATYLPSINGSGDTLDELKSNISKNLRATRLKGTQVLI